MVATQAILPKFYFIFIYHLFSYLCIWPVEWLGYWSSWPSFTIDCNGISTWFMGTAIRAHCCEFCFRFKNVFGWSTRFFLRNGDPFFFVFWLFDNFIGSNGCNEFVRNMLRSWVFVSWGANPFWLVVNVCMHLERKFRLFFSLPFLIFTISLTYETINIIYRITRVVANKWGFSRRRGFAG